MSTNIVKLNIGGTVFQTTKSTLTKYEGFFKTLMETSISIEKDETGCIFVDRCPKYFDSILNFMRDGDVVLPDSEKEVKEILKEAEFYLLQGLIELCVGELPAPPKAEVSKGVRIVRSKEEMEQLRDKTKPLLLFFYGEEYAVVQLSYSAFSFVQKHESRFDIFFQPRDGTTLMIQIRRLDGRKIYENEQSYLDTLLAMTDLTIKDFI